MEKKRIHDKLGTINLSQWLEGTAIQKVGIKIIGPVYFLN